MTTVPPPDKAAPAPPAFESPLRLRRRVGPRVQWLRARARPYRIEVKRFSKFLVVGAIGFVVDFGIFNLVSHVLDIAPAIAGAVSLVCAIFSNFTFNYFWVYPDTRATSLLVQFSQFFLVSISVAVMRVPLIQITHGPFGDLAGYALGLPAFAQAGLLLSRLLRLPTEQLPEVLGNNLALMLTVIIGLFWNFFANRLWTYRHAPRG